MKTRNYATLWFRIMGLMSIISGTFGLFHVLYVKFLNVDPKSYASVMNEDRTFNSIAYLVLGLLLFAFSKVIARIASAGIDNDNAV